MLRRSHSRETDIARYVEETLLGPVSQGSQPLFPQETRLRSILYRNGVVYADLSESAALPASETAEVFRNFYTLNEGIRRNFSYVRDVRLFIEGNMAYFNEFQRIFSAEIEK
jgi:spore germination protein GerM